MRWFQTEKDEVDLGILNPTRVFDVYRTDGPGATPSCGPSGFKTLDSIVGLGVGVPPSLKDEGEAVFIGW
jgi:hypothetical protein